MLDHRGSIGEVNIGVLQDEDDSAADVPPGLAALETRSLQLDRFATWGAQVVARGS